MKRLPIGVNDFKELIEEGYYFVDKSMLIKDILDLPGKIKLVTRPRRFGKTLNLSMIEHFFSLFREMDLFKGLAIWKERGVVKDHYHKYPVIFVSFKEIKATSWEDAKVDMKDKLVELVKKYKPFLKGKLKDPADEKELEEYVMGKKEPQEYKWVLAKLTRWFHQLYGKKAILLIDEYDVPIEAAYAYRYRTPDYYDDMVAFMRNMLTAALKDNEHLEFGILTGVYRVAKESIFSGLNNLAVYTVFENRMADRFGFTENETTDLLKHYGLYGKEDLQTVKEWYGGFRVGDYEPLYNPWSVIYYIAERLSGRFPNQAAQLFWINTSSNEIIEELIREREDLEEELDQLLEGKEIEQIVDPWLSLRELESRREGVWTLLVSGGYLTAKYIEPGTYALKIPNREVVEFFKMAVKSWLDEKTKTNMSVFMKALRDLMKRGKAGAFANILKGYIKNVLSYFDVGAEESERVYKGFLLGMLSIAVNGYMVESELESGYGRLDVVVYPKEKQYGKYAAIFEVKRASEDEGLENLANKALYQIREREYFAKMKALGHKVIGFGIAFCGKKVVVRTTEVT
ncbi:MAG: AAA family ATPase [Thermotogae bacterium]|nr:AAA family ATPase [Thermotogota bacterium]